MHSLGNVAPGATAIAMPLYVTPTMETPAPPMPQFIRSAYADLFREIDPEQLKLPEWVHKHIITANRGDVREKCKQALRDVIMAYGQEQHAKELDAQRLKDEGEALVKARLDMLATIQHMARQKARPMEELVSFEPISIRYPL